MYRTDIPITSPRGRFRQVVFMGTVYFISRRFIIPAQAGIQFHTMAALVPYNSNMTRNLPASKYQQKIDPLQEACPVRAALDVIRGRWKPSILHELCCGPKRYNEIRAAIPDISAQALTVQLRELMADEIVDRLVYDDSPMRVEYAITEFGMTLADVLNQLETWGDAYLARRRAKGE